MRYPLLTAIVFLLFTQAPLFSDKGCTDDLFEDDLLEMLPGSWHGRGLVGGDEVAYDFTASWELNHQFMRLDFIDTASVDKYAAKVFIGYDCPNHQYVAHWLDISGGHPSLTPGYGTREELSIEFRFDYDEGPLINKLTYDPKEDTWRFHATTVDKNGTWITFGDVLLKRKK